MQTHAERVGQENRQGEPVVVCYAVKAKRRAALLLKQRSALEKEKHRITTITRTDFYDSKNDIEVLLGDALKVHYGSIRESFL